MTFLPQRALPGLLPLLCAAFLQQVAGQPAPQAGMRIVDYIAELRAAGINVIYSDELVTDAMRAEAPPQGDGPLDRLRSMLAPHGLELRPGPRGSWLVARVPEPPPSPQPAPRAAPAPRPEIESIIVTASRYAFARSTAPSTQRLDRAQLESLPSLGDDALRAANDLPGVSTSGLSARFNVRGGETNETLFLLDGVRLYDPFHLKDFQSLFSSISPRILDSVEMRTGGYPAEFGDRMSAVVEMQTSRPSEARHHEVSVSLLSSSFLTSGRFDDDRGEWLASVRRGHLDLLADAADSDIGQPQYTDFFAKTSYALGSGWNVTGGILLLDDKLSLRDAPFTVAGADYDDGYYWLRFDHEPGAGIAATYLVSHGRIEARRAGAIDDPSLSLGALRDERSFDVDVLKADWSHELSARNLIRWGVELEDLAARYDVDLAAVFPAPIEFAGDRRERTAADVDLDLSGRQAAGYVAWRTRPLERLTAELGLRWDRQSYLDDEQVSPRAHLLFDFGERSSLRASWGRFYQSQGLEELQAADGAVQFFRPQEAEHLVLGFETLLGASLALRVEAYRKEFEHLRPRFENLYARVSLLPELLPDRVRIDPLRGEATGLEVTLDGEAGAWEWWASVARADVRDVLPGGRFRRSWDESWSAKAGATWTGARWTVSMAANAHDGWPVTALALEDGTLVAGELNALRFDDFASVDVRAARRSVRERVALSWFVEVTNVFGRQNPCCVDYTVGFDELGRPVSLDTELDEWLPTVPSIGFLLEF
ncbi:MAG TPA: TonB-dependent receptor [Gammaproteobacteria bacterium]